MLAGVSHYRHNDTYTATKKKIKIQIIHYGFLRTPTVYIQSNTHSTPSLETRAVWFLPTLHPSIYTPLYISISMSSHSAQTYYIPYFYEYPTKFFTPRTDPEKKFRFFMLTENKTSALGRRASQATHPCLSTFSIRLLLPFKNRHIRNTIPYPLSPLSPLSVPFFPLVPYKIPWLTM